MGKVTTEDMADAAARLDTITQGIIDFGRSVFLPGIFGPTPPVRVIYGITLERFRKRERTRQRWAAREAKKEKK